MAWMSWKPGVGVSLRNYVYHVRKRSVNVVVHPGGPSPREAAQVPICSGGAEIHATWWRQLHTSQEAGAVVA